MNEETAAAPSPMALHRYEIISAYLAAEAKRGQRGRLLAQLASRAWVRPDGRQITYSPETLRSWVRRYQRRGLWGLEDKPRVRRGVSALTPEVVERLCQLKRDVPERSLDRIMTIAEDLKLVEPGSVRRSTLHRVLRNAGLSARPRPAGPSDTDLDRFEADAPNDLWQSDMLVGPWLEDPGQPTKMRRTYLYAFLDDHSRLLLHGRFSFKGQLPALELVMRRSLQKYGLCRRCYYDNGLVYRSDHMKQIVATLGIHRIILTTPHRPMGHGKIEALNRLVRSAFIAELKASTIRTIDELNEAFIAWADGAYNRRTHAETGQTPIERWRASADKITYADERLLRRAFQWTECRTPDKSGVFSLFGRRYQADSRLGRRRVELRYDPEELDELELWHAGRFVQRVRPLAVSAHRRPRQQMPLELPQKAGNCSQHSQPKADWLGHLVAKRKQAGIQEPNPRQHVHEAKQQRKRQDERVLDVLKNSIDAAVFDENVIRSFLDAYGPFDAHRAALAIQTLLDAGRADHHVTIYLEAIRNDAIRAGEKL